MKVEQIEDVVSQIPQWVIDEITTPENVTIAEGDMVALMRPDAQDEDDEDKVVYAQLVETELGTRFDVCHVDAVGYAHPTGERKALLQYNIYEVAWWGDRVQGPLHSAFPLSARWLIDGAPFNLSNSCVKDTYDTFMLRKFKPPTSEHGWAVRLQLKVPWGKSWRVNEMYSAPRDKLTITKLMRRNLFTASKKNRTRTAGACAVDCQSPNSTWYSVK